MCTFPIASIAAASFTSFSFAITAARTASFISTREQGRKMDTGKREYGNQDIRKQGKQSDARQTQRIGVQGQIDSR